MIEARKRRVRVIRRLVATGAVVVFLGCWLAVMAFGVGGNPATGASTNAASAKASSTDSSAAGTRPSAAPAAVPPVSAPASAPAPALPPVQTGQS